MISATLKVSNQLRLDFDSSVGGFICIWHIILSPSIAGLASILAWYAL